MKKTLDRSIHFPLTQAVKIAILSLKVRWQRSLLIAISLVLAISFLAYVVETMWICSAVDLNRSFVALKRYCPSKNIGISSRQLWLITMSFLICLAGITNAQLMAVTERFREIGTFKCLGALDRFIVILLLVETSIYGFVGGSIGGFLGVILAILNFFMKAGISRETFSIVASYGIGITIFVSIVLSIVLSFLGAIYPVMIAARMEPSVALRHEE